MDTMLEKLSQNVIDSHCAIDIHFRNIIENFTKKHKVKYCSGMGSYFWQFGENTTIKYTMGDVYTMCEVFNDDDTNSLSYYGCEELTNIHNDFLEIYKMAVYVEKRCDYPIIHSMQQGDFDNSDNNRVLISKFDDEQ